MAATKAVINFRFGNPFARIEGGKFDECLLYCGDDADDPLARRVDRLQKRAERDGYKLVKASATGSLDKKYHIESKQIRQDDGRVVEVKTPVFDDSFDSDEGTAPKSMTRDEVINTIKVRKFQVANGATLRPVPERECTRVFVSGASESGKTTWASRYADEYHKMFPSNRIIIFSPTGPAPDKKKQQPAPRSEYSDDDDGDGDDDEKRKLDEKNYTPFKNNGGLWRIVDCDISELPFEELKNSLVVFDDVDSITVGGSKKSEALKAGARTLRDALLTRGRHSNISVLTTSHVFSDHGKTKLIHIECDLMVVFPINQNRAFMDRLKADGVVGGVKKLGRFKRDASDARYLCYHKSSPTFFYSDRGAWFADYD